LWNPDFLSHPPDPQNVAKRTCDQIFERLKMLNEVCILKGSFYSFYESKTAMSKHRNRLFSSQINNHVCKIKSPTGAPEDVLNCFEAFKKEFPSSTMHMFRYIAFLKACIDILLPLLLPVLMPVMVPVVPVLVMVIPPPPLLLLTLLPLPLPLLLTLRLPLLVLATPPPLVLVLVLLV
jgi:hypothetical protein